MPVNPFERFDLDIGASLADLTRALRERIEDAESETERAQLREIWETLTGKLDTRAALVLGALPKLAQPLTPAADASRPAPLAAHPLDTKPLPPFPAEWDALPDSKLPAPGDISLDADAAFAHLAQVELP